VLLLLLLLLLPSVARSVPKSKMFGVLRSCLIHAIMKWWHLFNMQADL
jgi:hypothetical protein